MDIFAVVRMFDQNGQEAVFTGAHEKVPVALGWLRASHRKLDAMKSKPWRPYHSHDEIQKLVPGEVCELDVEIWPTSMVYPKGYRLVLTIKGHDFVVTPPGRMLHNHIEDRNPAEFGGKNTLHTGGVHTSFLLMPLIPG
jgi:predicted acyl esterase